MVEINFGIGTVVPELIHEDLGVPNIKDISESLAKLKEQGLIEDNLQTEQYIRQVLNLPLLDEDDAAMKELSDEIDDILKETTIPELVPVSEEEDPNNENNKANEPRIIASEVSKLKGTLTDFLLQIQIDLTKKRAKGEDITKQDVAELRVKILEQRRKIIKQINDAKVKAEKNTLRESLNGVMKTAKDYVADVKNAFKFRKK